MAKGLDYDDLTDEKVEAILWPAKPNTLLAIKGDPECGTNETLCSRIHYHVNLKKNSIPEEKILILTTSKESVELINSNLKKKFPNGHNIDIFTFKDLVEHFLSKRQKFKNWKILDTAAFNNIKNEMKLYQKHFPLIYDVPRFKEHIQTVSVLPQGAFDTIPYEQLLVQYEVPDDLFYLKSVLGDTFYVTYEKVLVQMPLIPELWSQFKKYEFIAVANFHNLKPEENCLLLNLPNQGNKHSTVISNPSSPAKPHIFKQNYRSLNDIYKKEAKEITLHKKYSSNSCSKTSKPDPEPELSTAFKSKLNIKPQIEENEAKIIDSLLEKVLKNKKTHNNVEEIAEVIMKVFKNKKVDISFLQLMSLIPGFDSTFLKKFCQLKAKESNSVYDFLIKYQTALSDKTKAKILPVLNYLSDIEKRLDKKDPNSVMIHLLNVCHAAGVDTQSDEKMKEQFVQLHHWLKFLKEHKEFRVSDDLVECYIANGSFKGTPTYQNFIQPKKEKHMNATINFQLPVSITMDKLSTPHTTMKVETANTTLRRSNSVKYKSRPRSWHAGSLLNAAKKLR